MMPNVPDNSRRTVVLSLLGALLPRWSSALSVPVGGAPAPDLAGAVCKAFRCCDSAAHLGARYLATRPEEAECEGLLGKAGAAGVRFDALAFGDTTGFLASVRDVAQTEFLAGAVVDVDGWMMSRTEMRVLALVHVRAAPV